VKIAETQSASLACNVVGTPSPDVVWKTGSPPDDVFPLFHDDSDADRFVVNATGDLLITVARLRKLNDPIVSIYTVCQKVANNSRHTFSMLLHYLAKIKVRLLRK